MGTDLLLDYLPEINHRFPNDVPMKSVGSDCKANKSSSDIVLSLFNQPGCHPYQMRWLAVHTILLLADQSIVLSVI